MKKFSVLIVALVLAIGFVACKEKDNDADTKAPEITINAPEEGASVVAGQSFTLDVSLTDDTNLKTWSYSISLVQEAAKKNVVTWNYASTPEEISGTEVKKTPVVETQSDYVLGTYLITVVATDAAGNQATPATRQIELVLE